MCSEQSLFYTNGSQLPIGDWEYQSHGRGRVGMLMHLAAVIPIGFLLPWQFLPVIRHKLLWFHRINGYALLILLVFCCTGAILVAPGALGGTIETRLLVGILTISTIGAALMAYINIKRLQIDQHRAWMLRCWAYAFNIISLRLIQLCALEIISRMKSFQAAMSCSRIDSALSIVQPGMAALFYPGCKTNPNAYMAVLADAYPDPTPEGTPRLDRIAAASQVTFAMSGVMALLLHAFAVEVYLHLTQAEANRLKRVSHERQLQKGWTTTWLTRETWGDADEFNYGGTSKRNDTRQEEDGMASLVGSKSPTREAFIVDGNRNV